MEILVVSLAPLIFFIFTISTFILLGAFFKKTVGVLLTSVIGIAILFILNISETIKKFNPVSLLDFGNSVLLGHGEIGDYIGSFVISIFLVVLFLWLSILLFKRKES